MDPKMLLNNIQILGHSNLSTQGFPRDLLATRSGKLSRCKGLLPCTRRILLRVFWLHRGRLRSALQKTQEGLEELADTARRLSEGRPLPSTQVLQWPEEEDPLTQSLQIIQVVQTFHQLKLANAAETRLRLVSQWGNVDKPDLWEAYQAISNKELLDQLEALRKSMGLLSEVEQGHSPLERIQELLASKDAIIETLQSQLEQKLETPSTPPLPPQVESPPARAALDAEEHERHLQDNRIAQDVEVLLNVIEEMEQGHNNHAEALPAPLSLAREIGLHASGRKPQLSLDECHSSLQEAIRRLSGLQEAWIESKTRLQELEQQATTGGTASTGEGWLELGEEEVRELEQSMARLQARFERLKKENEELKKRLADTN